MSMPGVNTQPRSQNISVTSASSITISVSSTNCPNKRKASDLELDISLECSRPSKIRRKNLGIDDDDNPFLDTYVQLSPIEATFSEIFSAPTRWQKVFNDRKVPYGVQYEIARHVSVGTLEYENIHVDDIQALARLRLNAKAVPAMASTLFKKETEISLSLLFEKEYKANSPWEELDKEEEGLKIDPLSGLGFNARGERTEWYGGQINFRATLRDARPKGKSTPQYKMVLEVPERGVSCQFARRFGSKSLLRVKLTKNCQNSNSEQLIKYLKLPLILCGYVFRAFYAKDTTVFYMKTNEVYENGHISKTKSISGVLSLLEFLDWHNPIVLNKNQTMAKWASRFALGLSTSVPGIMLERSQIKFVPSKISSTGSEMDDGAGLINRTAALMLRDATGLEEMSSAFQVRVFGGKGLLVVESRKENEEPPRITLRESQIKIKYPDDRPDPAHCIIDLLRSSRPNGPAHLSAESIINLGENGVPQRSFTDLLKNSLDNLVDPLTQWEGDQAMKILWSSLCRIGGVMSARKAREDAGLARLRGFYEREGEEADDEDDEGLGSMQVESTQKSSAWWYDQVSGCPSTLEETIMDLLVSGFTPFNCSVLLDKLQKFIKQLVKNHVKSYRITVPLSTKAFIVPDDQNVLKEGEVFYRSSRRHLPMADGSESDIIVGDVLLTRHPCKLPTDIQKWKAVDHSALHYLTDVIVLPVAGERRAADFLSGGDYDGDTASIIYQPELVNPFIVPPLKYSKPPRDIDSYFYREIENVPQFLERVKGLSNELRLSFLQDSLLGAVRDPSSTGKYSKFHDNSIYVNGYTHNETIRLAYMFCIILDGIKSGHTVSQEALNKDAQRYNKRPPSWKETDEEKGRAMRNSVNTINLERPRHLPPFIMDTLCKAAIEEGDKRLRKIELLFSNAQQPREDVHLTAPWRKAVDLSRRWLEQENNSRMEEDLKAIMKHVQDVYTRHRLDMRMSSPRKAVRLLTQKASFTDLPIEIRQDRIRDISKEFASGPSHDRILMSEEEIAILKASYAYYYDLEQKRGSNGWTRFPWDVAFRDLCGIKARACGPHMTILNEFQNEFNMKIRPAKKKGQR